MDKQTAQRLLDEMPEGTQRVCTNKTLYLNMSRDVMFFHRGIDGWVTHSNQSVARKKWDEAVTVEQLREIAMLAPPEAPCYPREMALQWCVDNVDAWPTDTTPNGWEWATHYSGEIHLIEKDATDTITELDWATAKTPMFTIADDDPVRQPKHYEVIEGLEAIEIIASSLTRDEWKGYCVGNILKYRLRAGKKDALQQDVDKANEYEMLFDKYKELNRK